MGMENEYKVRLLQFRGLIYISFTLFLPRMDFYTYFYFTHANEFPSTKADVFFTISGLQCYYIIFQSRRRTKKIIVLL